MKEVKNFNEKSSSGDRKYHSQTTDLRVKRGWNQKVVTGNLSTSEKGRNDVVTFLEVWKERTEEGTG